MSKKCFKNIKYNEKNKIIKFKLLFYKYIYKKKIIFFKKIFTLSANFYKSNYF